VGFSSKASAPIVVWMVTVRRVLAVAKWALPRRDWLDLCPDTSLTMTLGPERGKPGGDFTDLGTAEVLEGEQRGGDAPPTSASDRSLTIAMGLSYS
jgi:hypothetical protein